MKVPHAWVPMIPHAWGVMSTHAKGVGTININSLKSQKAMLEFNVKAKVQPVGERKGQTVYYAQVKSQQKMTNKMVVERIVRETSLSEAT